MVLVSKTKGQDESLWPRAFYWNVHNVLYAVLVLNKLHTSFTVPRPIHHLILFLFKGVGNTDNFSLLSITIDYGPFGFMEAYNPSKSCCLSLLSKLYTKSSQVVFCPFTVAAIIKGKFSVTLFSVVPFQTLYPTHQMMRGDIVLELRQMWASSIWRNFWKLCILCLIPTNSHGELLLILHQIAGRVFLMSQHRQHWILLRDRLEQRMCWQCISSFVWPGLDWLFVSVAGLNIY